MLPAPVPSGCGPFRIESAVEFVPAALRPLKEGKREREMCKRVKTGDLWSFPALSRKNAVQKEIHFLRISADRFENACILVEKG